MASSLAVAFASRRKGCDGIKPRCRNATTTSPSGGWYHVEPSSMQGSWLFRNRSLEGATPDEDNDNNIKKRPSMDLSETNTRNSISSSPSALSSCEHGSSDDLIDAGGPAIIAQ
ncbi:hypothetical protein FALCPG4_013616 [Fusarium falciforme]